MDHFERKNPFWSFYVDLFSYTRVVIFKPITLVFAAGGSQNIFCPKPVKRSLLFENKDFSSKRPIFNVTEKNKRLVSLCTKWLDTLEACSRSNTKDWGYCMRQASYDTWRCFVHPIPLIVTHEINFLTSISNKCNTSKLKSVVEMFSLISSTWRCSKHNSRRQVLRTRTWKYVTFWDCVKPTTTIGYVVPYWNIRARRHKLAAYVTVCRLHTIGMLAQYGR